ncbi:MAG: YHYH protein [Acidimicrobiia bacterium]|nr:YHYH protein [Acidimicrobiia bacterium]
MNKTRGLFAMVVLVIAACGASADDLVESSDSTTPTTSTATPSNRAPNEAWLNAWIINDSGETAGVIGSDVEVNVQSAEIVEVDGAAFMAVSATGIPNYTHTITNQDETFLTSRRSSDFTGDGLIISAGDEVAFGEDIGYNSTGCTSTDGTGFGYWPPGPACPTEQSYDVLFPLSPVLADGGNTSTGLGMIGLWVNGVAIFGWGDGQSYNNERVWENLAPVAESYDLDICPGHSAMGTYHHHSYPTCLADQLGDTGDSHSPIYGFASDGFPIYGPWVADGVLARSSWTVRDYEDPTSSTGCGEAGIRSCLLLDQTDPAAGTVATSSIGPTTSDTVTSMSNNVFQATAGYFLQDYYYESGLNDGTLEALDQFNGHDHDGLGYHYHVTLAVEGDQLVDAFPYYVGIEFAGVVGDSFAAAEPVNPGGQAPVAPDLSGVASALGVTVEKLERALGEPPPDLAAAAAELGITEKELMEALAQSGLGPPP